MKKIILMVGVLCLSVGAAEASSKRKAKPKPKASGGYQSSYEEPRAPRAAMKSAGHSMAGCGLGSMVIEDQTKWAQVGAAFLNGTGVQTFGISFGTSNCTEDGVASASKERDVYVESNFSEIRRDIAMGEGEYLSGLAQVYGCDANGFSSALKKNQSKISEPSSAVNEINAILASESVNCQG